MLEALDPPYYYGGAKFFNRGGHVPHAKLTPVSDFFGPDKRFKPRADLQAMLDHLGVRREQQIYSYCGGGVAASVPFFALKFLLDYPRVALYQGSQKEWLEDARGLPLWSHAEPALLRDADWLNGFSNTMLRTFSHSPISIIDVRPAEAYAKGHVPFALSLPFERFQAGLAAPERLAALLGPAGVDPQHEAVIVSEGGLNKRSALVFALLEQLGQRKVSLLLESAEEWELRGLQLSREPLAWAPQAAAGSDHRAGRLPSQASYRPDEQRSTGGHAARSWHASGLPGLGLEPAWCRAAGQAGSPALRPAAPGRWPAQARA